MKPSLATVTRAIPLLLALLSVPVLGGCASMQAPRPIPEPAAAESLSVQFSRNSSLRYDDPERARRAAEWIAENGSRWQSRLFAGEPDARYELVIHYDNGEERRFAVAHDSIALQDNGVRYREHSEDELRELDRVILGENPYQRFAGLSFEQANR